MNPLMEGLFLFSEKNTNEEILQSVRRFGKEFGVNIIELHLHRDDGYYNRYEEWIPNLHRHFVFENIERREVLLERNRLKEAYERKLEDREKAYGYLRRDFGELEQKLERKEEELIKAIHLVFNQDDREDYIKEKRESVHQRMMKGVEEIVEKEDVISYYQEMDAMIRAEMYQLDRKSNCWTLLNHVMGEDYEKKLYEKLSIIEQESKKRKEKEEEKEKQEIEEIVKTKETSISLSNQIQTTQQKEEQQVQHFRRKR